MYDDKSVVASQKGAWDEQGDKEGQSLQPEKQAEQEKKKKKKEEKFKLLFGTPPPKGVWKYCNSLFLS